LQDANRTDDDRADAAPSDTSLDRLLASNRALREAEAILVRLLDEVASKQATESLSAAPRRIGENACGND
jgi:hypothetical protein